MTKEDIKNALEFCSAINSPCVNCPYKNVENCYDTLNNDALNLIIEQESEIEELKAEIKHTKIDVLNTARERCDLVAEELEDEIDHYGSSAAHSCAYEIKKLIKEIEEQ